MDPAEVIRLLRSLEEGSIEKEDAEEILEIMVRVLDKMQPSIEKMWARMMIHAIKGTLQEMKDHVGQIP